RNPSGRAVSGLRFDLVPEPGRVLVDDAHLGASSERRKLSRAGARLLAHDDRIGQTEGADAKAPPLCGPAARAAVGVRVRAADEAILVSLRRLDLVPLVEYLDDADDGARVQLPNDVSVRARLCVEARRTIDDEIAGAVASLVLV